MQQAKFGLSENDLAGGGVEVYQFAPYVSYCSAPAPGNVRCAMELVASRTVTQTALSILREPTPDVGVRIRFVAGIKHDNDADKIISREGAILHTVVRQPGARHPFMLYTRDYEQGGFGHAFDPIKLEPQLKKDVIEKLRANHTLYDSLLLQTNAVALLAGSRAEIARLKAESDRKRTVFTLGKFSLVRQV